MTIIRSESDDSFASKVVIMVDPYSTGCLVAQEIAKRGFSIMAVWSKGFSMEMRQHIPRSCGPLNYIAEVEEKETMAETAKACQAAAGPDYKLHACLAGGEAGVDCADALSEYLGLLTNGTQGAFKNRRDKKVQQELIAKQGLRSVRQAGGDKFEDIEAFLKTEDFPVVLKPTESAGSDGVKLCNDFQEAKDHFHVLMKSQMVNGGNCPAVLAQEFLRGKEYVIDHTSYDGVHKTNMLWVYDKRSANGCAFVYFGMIPVDSESPEAQILIPYVRTVLDALGIRYGPSHCEVMMTSDGPCLVEMNCRAHGGDGNWRPLSGFITGYSQVEATADCFVDRKAFARIPDKPPSPFKASGQEVMFVSFSKGKVKSTPGYDVIQKLPSFVSYETGIKPGSEVDYTVDLFTGIGGVILMHSDDEVLKQDVEFIRYLEKINGFFVYENQMENLKRPRGESIVLSSVGGAKGGAAGHRRVFSSDGPNLIRHMSNDRPELRGPLMKRMTTVDSSKECVVLVDPYSTGCLVAEEIMKRGYKVIALWTHGFSQEMRKHVPLSVGHLTYMAEVEEDEKGDLQETSNRVYKAAGVLRVVAVMCGGEAGIDLTDALSEKLNLRTNGTHIPCKRDKMIQQELIRKRGLRSVRGASGRKFSEVEAFLRREKYPVVLKPTESAGSDGVKLCYNIDEAKEHFEALMQSQMVNGGQCPAVVCQEFLRGKEYVVDMVSRDGKHRCMMVWVYDKRVANGSAFVYFGCIPVDSESPEAKILISYTKRVLDSLEVTNGPSHNEIMMMNDGPCLVEANVRCHGGDGNWRSLCRELCGGYSQVESAVDSFLDAKAFAITPEKPASPFKAAGQEVILVSYARGKVKSTPGFDAIMKRPSYVYLETGVQPGVEVDYTTDLFTGIGSVILMHKDADVVKQDIEFIRDLEKTNKMFVLEASQVLFKSPSTNALGDIEGTSGSY